MESKEATADVVETAEGDKGVEIGEVQVPTSGEGQQKLDEEKIGEHEKGDHVEGEHVEGDQTEAIVSELAEGDETLGEHVGGEQVASDQLTEYTEGEQTEGEQTEGEQTEGEQTEGEQSEGEGDERVLGEGEEFMFGEQGTEEEEEGTGEAPCEEIVEEEVGYVEEPPPDPAAPYNFSDSQELLKDPFKLEPDKVAEVEQLWDVYQNYNPAYTDLDGYITEKELVYMLKCLLIMTYTPEQLQELITFCVRPPHPQGHITYEQFLRMVTVRQRDFFIEDELRAALQVLDPEKEGVMNREYLREVLSKLGYKMPPKILDRLIKEVDISNDGTIGIEDVIGTMCIDLNTEDIIMLRESLFPKKSAGNEDAADDDK